jgi:nucleoside-diphosphate-sugar epimerase
VSDKRVLVTGATGFIGAVLVRELRRTGHDVVGLSSRDGDIARFRLDLAGIDHVFHLAGKSFVPDSWRSPAAFYETNVLGTVNVLDACRRSDVSMTFVSSYVYGRPRRLPIGERHRVQAFNPYSHTKILAEDAVRFYQRYFGVRTVVVRPFNVYGPGQRGAFIVPSLIRQAIDKTCREIVVRDARPQRDYLHVRDLVALLIATLGAPPGRVYNAGSGKPTSVRQLVEAVRTAAGTKKPLKDMKEPRRHEVFTIVSDVSRARRELKWRPRIGLREGLDETVRWTLASRDSGTKTHEVN